MSWIDKLFGAETDREGVEDPFRTVTSMPDLDAAMGSPLAVIYKHSPICGISNWTVVEVRQFAIDHPDIPVFFLDVVRQRGVSSEIEHRLGVRHESPQVILLRHGEAVWNASHAGVSDAGLRAAVSEVFPPPDPVVTHPDP